MGGIVLVALIWILTPLIALPAAWVRWYRGRNGQTGSRRRDRIILKGLIAATIALSTAAFLLIAADVNPNLQAEPMASKLVGSLSIFALPAALFSIYAAIAGEGRGRVSLLIVGLMTGIYWLLGFISIFKTHWLA
jgi:hypothetical protein